MDNQTIVDKIESKIERVQDQVNKIPVLDEKIVNLTKSLDNYMLSNKELMEKIGVLDRTIREISDGTKDNKEEIRRLDKRVQSIELRETNYEKATTVLEGNTKNDAYTTIKERFLKYENWGKFILALVSFFQVAILGTLGYLINLIYTK